MTVDAAPLAIALTRSEGDQRLAAGIWARATAARDGLGSPVDPAAMLAGIRQRLALPDASLHLARLDGTAIGFTVVVPRGLTLEITYLAVEPDHWGDGVAEALLAHVEHVARAQRFATIDLWVIDDNDRAIARYQRGGFAMTADVQDSGGRLERRLERHLYPA